MIILPNYFFKTKANNKCFIVLEFTYKATEKFKWVIALKSKPNAWRHFKGGPVLKIYETFDKLAESMPFQIILGSPVDQNILHMFVLKTKKKYLWFQYFFKYQNVLIFKKYFWQMLKSWNCYLLNNWVKIHEKMDR